MNIDYVHHDTKTIDEEKFMEEVERRYIKNHTTHIKGYTEEYVNKLNQQIDQLTNNWNELEEWLESNWKDTQDIWYVKIINKMNKIKDGNNVSDRD